MYYPFSVLQHRKTLFLEERDEVLSNSVFVFPTSPASGYCNFSEVLFILPAACSSHTLVQWYGSMIKYLGCINSLNCTITTGFLCCIVLLHDFGYIYAHACKINWFLLLYEYNKYILGSYIVIVWGISCTDFWKPILHRLCNICCWLSLYYAEATLTAGKVTIIV
jgi:hypothetical protein